MNSLTHPSLGQGPKLTAIWQSEQAEKEWLEYNTLMRFFAPYIKEHVVDGKHQVVMDNAIVFDIWIYAVDPSYYARFRGMNAFLVHIGDEFYELGADRYVNFRGVFRSYWSGVFNPKDVKVLPLGSSVPNTIKEVVPASERRYVWSFVGDAGKSSRPEMVRGMSHIEPHLCFSTTAVSGMVFWNTGLTGPTQIPRPEVAKILEQSVFAPAPMGNANLECFRVYEALEAGAIPIIERRLSLDYFRNLFGDHPLPTVRSWREARRLVSRLLRDPVGLDARQKECYQWWIEYQSSVVHQIGCFLTERSAAGKQAEPLISRLPSIPGWQYCELLRHQTARALYRRVAMQITRSLKRKTWRVALRSDSRPERS